MSTYRALCPFHLGEHLPLQDLAFPVLNVQLVVGQSSAHIVHRRLLFCHTIKAVC